MANIDRQTSQAGQRSECRRDVQLAWSRMRQAREAHPEAVPGEVGWLLNYLADEILCLQESPCKSEPPQAVGSTTHRRTKGERRIRWAACVLFVSSKACARLRCPQLCAKLKPSRVVRPALALPEEVNRIHAVRPRKLLELSLEMERADTEACGATHRWR